MTEKKPHQGLGAATPWMPVEEQIRRWFPAETHPYRALEREIAARLRPSARVLDIGCGRTAPNLAALKGRATSLTGVDLVAFTVDDPALRLVRQDIAAMTAIADASVDLAYSRSVMEHVENAEGAFREIARVLAPGGAYVFLTPNKHDYASTIARLVPNRLHGRIVKATEGRDAEDVFPTRYRCNTPADMRRLTAGAGLVLERCEYLGQYPAYFRFNRAVFWLGGVYEKLLDAAPALARFKGWILAVAFKPLGGPAV